MVITSGNLSNQARCTIPWYSTFNTMSESSQQGNVNTVNKANNIWTRHFIQCPLHFRQSVENWMPYPNLTQI